MTNIIMIVILALLIFIIGYNAKFVETSRHLFNKENTNAMRGFWCLVVILVHVPSDYVNRIQDIIGSFGYIGVTFFFMTSAFGLSIGINEENLSFFWRRRLPKLAITCWVINILSTIISFAIAGRQPNIISIVKIDPWVRWLLVCYFIFWISNIVCKQNKTLCNICTIVLVAMFSLSLYHLHTNGMYTSTAWVAECYGFIWGILLAWFYTKFFKFFKEKWFMKLTISCVVSLLLGVSYLIFKPIPFWGDYILKIVLGFSITLFIIISNVKVSYGNKINQFLGDISFEIYLIHGTSFAILEAALGGQLSSGVFIILSIMLTVALAYFVHLIVKRLNCGIYKTKNN